LVQLVRRFAQIIPALTMAAPGERVFEISTPGPRSAMP
jgi:hypothetical protein